CRSHFYKIEGSLRFPGGPYPNLLSFPELRQKMEAIESELTPEQSAELREGDRARDDFWRKRLPEELFENYEALHSQFRPPDATVAEAISNLCNKVDLLNAAIAGKAVTNEAH